MSEFIAENKVCKNHLLAALSENEYALLAPQLERVHLHTRQPLHAKDQEISYVYFPCNGMNSLISHMEDGASIEIGTVGNEGFVGIELLVGSNVAIDAAICQVEGENLRMRAEDFREAVAGVASLRTLAQRYCQAYLRQLYQTVACNRMHTVDERFARWMLLTHDRLQKDEFHLTQEFIAAMLGVQRPSVSMVANAFQQAGLIRYTRGNMKILDRAGLKQQACECYSVVREQFSRLLGIQYG